MKLRIALLAALSMLATPLLPVVAAHADGERLALIIGNAKYPDNETPLKEPINDARDIADELKRDGFEVEIGENLSGEAMRRALDKFYGQIKPGTAALIFFSGFGIQSARQSYILPVDAQIWTEADVRRDGFSLETILGEINSRGAGVKIALLDASRRNPFERRFRSFSAGLAPVIAPSGSLVMYSAALSSVVGDSGAERSLFVGELLKEIRVPDLTAEETLNRTRVGVTRASRSEQVPWISSSLAEDFAFVAGAKVAKLDPKPLVSEVKPAAQPPATTEPAKPVAVATQPEPAKPAEAKPVEAKPIEVKPIEAKPVEVKPAETSVASLAHEPTVAALNAKIAANPKDVNSLYRRGQVYASKGAYSAAIKDFDETLKLNPKDVEALNNRCWTRTVVGELSTALHDCNEALRLRPGFVDALDSRGLLYLKSGKAKDAIVDFDAALKVNPRLTSSLYGRGLAKQRSGATAAGELDITNAKAMDPNIAKEFAGYGVN
ncbi:MAG: caspase family protein [Rhizobiales bacterium]|nr:caspase family protein [Hyphomicrobiales bacterium]MBN8984251.1 caspase family protein [Hyphomicrobiales bacterium]MBN9002095.1 caspase family protein [Hyphomicrobiales bacterium]